MKIIDKNKIKNRVLSKRIEESIGESNLVKINEISISEIAENEWGSERSNNAVISLVFVSDNAGYQKIEDFIVNTITTELQITKLKKEKLSEEKIKEIFMLSPLNKSKLNEYTRNIEKWSSKEITESRKIYTDFPDEKRILEDNLKNISKLLSENNVLLLYLSPSEKLVSFKNKGRNTAKEILTTFEINKTQILKSIKETTGSRFNDKLKKIVNDVKWIIYSQEEEETINELTKDISKTYETRKRNIIPLIKKAFERARKVFNIIDSYISRTDTSNFSYKEISLDIEEKLNKNNIYINKELEQNENKKENIKMLLMNENAIIEAMKKWGVKTLASLKRKIKNINPNLEIVSRIDNMIDEIKKTSQKSLYVKILDKYVNKFEEINAKIISKNKNNYLFNYNALLRDVFNETAVTTLLKKLIIAISFISYYLENRGEHELISYEDFVTEINEPRTGGLIRKSLFRTELPSLYKQITNEQSNQTLTMINEEVNETIDELEKRMQTEELWVLLKNIQEYLSLSSEYINNLSKQVMHYLQINYGIENTEEAIDFIKNNQDNTMMILRNIAIEIANKHSQQSYDYIIREVVKGLSYKNEETAKSAINKAITEIKKYSQSKQQKGNYNDLIRENTKRNTIVLASSNVNNLFKKLIIDIIINTIDAYKLFSPIALGIVVSERITGIERDETKQLEKIVTILNSKNITLDKKLETIEDQIRHEFSIVQSSDIVERISKKQGIIETINLATDIIRSGNENANNVLKNTLKSVADWHKIMTIEKENYIKENFNELNEMELRAFDEFEDELRRWWDANNNREVQKIYNYKGEGE
ncbi:MAG: hypothetical protein NZM44_06575 [Candidatus Calescibacterium sp.]|nr:hypothetical protein [Candidatus Calescibacterium sp.]